MKRKKTVNIRSDSEESDDSLNKPKPNSTLQPKLAKSYDKSVIYHQKPEFESDRTFRKREQKVIIIESDSEESDSEESDSDDSYANGKKKQTKNNDEDSDEAANELFLADIVRKVTFLNPKTPFSIYF